MNRLIFLNIFFLIPLAFAEKHVELSLIGSKSDSQLAFSFDYFQPGEDNEIIWSSNVQTLTSRSKVKDPILDESDTYRQLRWTNSWNYYDQWFFNLGVGGSNTKIDQIKTQQIELMLGSDFNLIKLWNWSLTAGFNKISQDKAFGNLEKLSLNQRSLTADIGTQLSDVYSVGLFFSSYWYEEDLDAQITRLSTPAAVQVYGTAFSDNLSSLPQKTLGIELNGQWSDKWSGRISHSRSEDAPNPQVKSQSFDISVKNQYNQDWDLSLMFATTRVESSSVNTESRFNYVGLSLGYSWF